MQFQSLTTWVAITICILLTLSQRASSDLTVDPVELAVETGQEATFTCKHVNETRKELVQWKFAGSSSDNNTSQLITNSTRFQVVGGKLTISNTSHADSGIYNCEDDAITQTATLKVYDMPDYFEEGLIIACVSAFLLVVITVGVVIRAMKQKRRYKRRNRKSEDKRLVIN